MAMCRDLCIRPTFHSTLTSFTFKSSIIYHVFFNHMYTTRLSLWHIGNSLHGLICSLCCPWHRKGRWILLHLGRGHQQPHRLTERLQTQNMAWTSHCWLKWMAWTGYRHCELQFLLTKLQNVCEKVTHYAMWKHGGQKTTANFCV